ncbi:MSHA biogenesis protein MshP [Vibrio alginolyticus]|uniref:MSHA biogenesis protein MshP n=1 Tax=Vibrio alginolyticus TaxID=663 RepID=UPI001E0C2885|nr:MSHA biogenesis protein MshP [Vibrio alginolyticus]EGQ8497379.1 MSHA biogenesis protein MshP [Vibrio alginolyticus]EJL6791824.1 MSHA biogenesis protein MshP [Vibrio alginolyticus]ELB1500829.1 MSHA biogenesis protein MshP [Vibrio alginolyticus]ELC9557528.1 MSHA biogenesis protein MshP [Vibrio alginolyticus]ULF82884.1 MSHA biogenesis protein MshP [Vibrio alginolyticus]
MFHNKQKGNVLIVTLFVIIVMGYLAASLMKVTWSNQSGLTREFLGTKAWFTAQSSNDWVLTQFFPLSSSAAVKTRCDDIEAKRVKPDSDLFDKACKVTTIECQEAGKLPGDFPGKEVELYVVKSVAVCGSGLSQVQRQQEVWVRE